LAHLSISFLASPLGGTMPIYALGDRVPTIHEDAYVHPEAVIIGDVRIGKDSTIWPGAVLRGDYGTIIVGERTSIQDGSVIHATAELQTTVGDDCVIGHIVHLEGCTIHNGALVGNGANVLHRAVVNTGATVAAGAVVRNDAVIPENALAVGVPAIIKENASHAQYIIMGAALYVENGKRYKKDLRKL